MITGLPKEERPALNKLGIRIGAYYIYEKDILKPAALHLKAALWRIFKGAEAANTSLPQSGNVSMACPENGNRDFYRAMGFPVFGKTCVRVDMVERLNSAIFDGAVEGKYKFDPSLASVVGVSVETVQFILTDLGFRFDDVTETTGEGEAAVTTTTRFYHVRKKPARLNEPKKFEGKKTPPPFEKLDSKTSNAGKKNFKKNHAPKRDEAPKQKAITGYNAFAELAALQKKK
jgi:hypothetical protein